MSAQDLLEQAEAEDEYRKQCQRDRLNGLARAQTTYIPWHDQSDAVRYEKLLNNSVKCVIMNPTADGGMPHTRGVRSSNVICIPAHWSPSSIESTLRHEMIHIHQKRYPDLWKAKLLEEGWQADVQIPSDIARRCRLNPDTLQNRFCAWEGRYVPLPLFVREDRPTLREIQVRWYDLEEERIRVDPPLSYTKRYGSVSDSAMEHPYELIAYHRE